MTTTTTLIVVVLSVVSFSSPRRPDRKCPSYCFCWHHKLTCDGERYPIHYIPRAPPDTKTAKLINISLGQLTKDSISNLTHCKLTSLSFIGTNITNIEKNTFEDLVYLEVLNVDQTFIPISAISLCVQSIKSKLKGLHFKAGSTDGNSMNASVFQDLAELTDLTLSLGKLETFNCTALSCLHNLTDISLSNNHLRHIVLDDVLPNVIHFNLDGNDLREMPQICRSDSAPVMPRLRNLNIRNNAVKYLDVSPLACLHNLLKLTLSENRIDEIEDNAFANLPRLESLQMSKLPLRRIHDHAFNSSSLYKLVFVANPILTAYRFNPAVIFKNTPNLGVLDMTNTKIKIRARLFKEFLLSLRNIEKLVLQGTKIMLLPSGVFSMLSKLKTLILSGNYFAGWKKDVFENVTSIEKISFDGCNIKIIREDSFPLEFRLSVKEINLADNPFTCTCDLLWFRNWMKEVIANKSIKFLRYPLFYECHAPNVKRVQLRDFNPTAQSCTISTVYTHILTIVFCFCIVSVVVGLVAYRYRWHMLYWISLLRRRRQRQQQELLLREMKYDAFVSYSNSDNDWIYDELLNYLEGDLGLRLCEHSRDFEAGKLIVDNVFEAMDTSRKTILVISNDYMQSDWCQFELQMALNSFYKHETDLVVVLLEAIQARHVTSTLRALMTSTTYIEWSEDVEAKALFRERLKNAL